jgi:SAM-dependent methyltransferase
MRTGVTTTEYTIADQQRMKSARRYFEWQSMLAERELGKRVLEVGCGLGNFTQHLGERDFVVGIDIDDACVAHWQERFSDRGHYVGFKLDAAQPEFQDLKKYGIDSIACLNVLEHIENDLQVLKNMHEILPPQGRVVLIVPAFKALYGKIDELLGHCRRYTRSSMGETARSAGFRVRSLKYMNTVGFFGWWANAKVFKRSEQSEAQIAVFDSYIVPVMSRLESWVSPPFGQSIITVLEKP